MEVWYEPDPGELHRPFLAQLHEGTTMRARSGCTFAMLTALAACSGKERPFADGPSEGLGGTSAVGPTTIEPGSAGTSQQPGLGPAASDGESLEGVSIDTLSPLDDASQSGGTRGCESDAGTCTPSDAGPVPPACTPTGPRDCTSDADNDCDGQPDNSLDAICACVSGASEPCDEHTGLDGQGQCRAGLRTCVLDEVTRTTSWGACEGAVGPGAPDSCEPGNDTDCDGTPNEGCSCVDGQTQPCGSTTDTGPCQIGASSCEGGAFGQCVGAVAPAPRDSCALRGDDSNCNGVPNEGCSCIDGETQPCGPDTDVGICQRGTRTCSNGVFGQCVGDVFPAARNCRSQQDNDCDGRADNTLDNVCTCAIGQTQVCDEHPGQDGNGRCRAGQRRCEAGPGNGSSALGACTGSVGPLPRDCESSQDNDCDGRPDDTIDAVCRAPECGDGITNGDEVCDAGRNPLPQPGGCNPECTGVYASKQIRRSLDIHGSNLGGIAGADAICAGDFGQGWKALLVGSSRRATLSPFVGDGQLDWVLKPFTYYFNERNQLAWRTDDVALLGASGGEQQPLFAPLFITTPLNGGGSYPWSGYDVDWTTTADTCNSWTSTGGRDANGQFMQGSFVTETLAGIAVERCSATPYLFLLCVEQ